MKSAREIILGDPTLKALLRSLEQDPNRCPKCGKFETMPVGRVLATSVWRCNCAAGIARERREI